MTTNGSLGRKLRMGLVGGGAGSFIGRVHSTAAVLDNRATLVAGALSSDPVRAKASAPDIAECLFERITAFYLEYARRTFEAAGDGLDVFMTGDDFGTQHGLFMSPAMWRRFLRPGFEALIQLGKKYGYKVMHHSCGSITPIIPDMIECGLDILNPVQPGVHDMAPADLKVRFGDRLCFHGSISIQQTLPFGTPQEVRDEVRNRFETLGVAGGFIYCTAHNIQVDTRWRTSKRCSRPTGNSAAIDRSSKGFFTRAGHVNMPRRD